MYIQIKNIIAIVFDIIVTTVIFILIISNISNSFVTISISIFSAFTVTTIIRINTITITIITVFVIVIISVNTTFIITINTSTICIITTICFVFISSTYSIIRRISFNTVIIIINILPIITITTTIDHVISTIFANLALRVTAMKIITSIIITRTCPLFIV